MSNVNLVVARESVHKGKYLTLDTFINDMIDKQIGVIVLRISSIDISVINTNPNGPLLLIEMNNIGEPLFKGMG